MSPLSNEQHISQEDLLRYVEDDCSRTEMRAIDRHLATCPMCSDAIEGLMLLSEPMVVIDNLNKKIDEKVAEISSEKPVGQPINLPVEPPILQVIKRPFWQQRWAAAAAVLVLVSSSIWIYQNTQKAKNKAVARKESVILPNFGDSLPPQYAAAESAKTSNNSAELSAQKEGLNQGELAQLKPESAPLNDPKNGDLQEDWDKKTDAHFKESIPQKATAPNTEVAVADQSVAAEKGVSAAPTRASAPAAYAPENDRTRDYTGASAQNSVPSPTSMSPNAKDATVTAIEESKTKKTEASKKMKDAVVTGQAKAKKSESPQMPPSSAPTAKPSMPVILADSMAAKHPSASTASDQILSRADGYFKQNYYETAATHYTQFLNIETSGDRHERALFQLATCYVKVNRKAEAKIIFEKLSAMNGQYGRTAKKALKDL